MKLDASRVKPVLSWAKHHHGVDRRPRRANGRVGERSHRAVETLIGRTDLIVDSMSRETPPLNQIVTGDTRTVPATNRPTRSRDRIVLVVEREVGSVSRLVLFSEQIAFP